jgi:hypothetical protein
VERTALSALAAVLDPLGVHWVLIGALAVNRYRASTRLTQDVDLLLAGAGPAGLPALERALEAAGWSVRRASPEGAVLRLRHAELGTADLKRPPPTSARQSGERDPSGCETSRRPSVCSLPRT